MGVSWTEFLKPRLGFGEEHVSSECPAGTVTGKVRDKLCEAPCPPAGQ